MPEKKSATTETDDKGLGLHVHSSTQLVLVLIALFGIYLYAQFLYNPANAGNTLPYILVLVAESFLMLQAVINLWTIVSGGYNPRDTDYYYAQVKLLGAGGQRMLEDLRDEKGEVLAGASQLPMRLLKKPLTVDVFVTVYGEPLDAIRNTVIHARDMAGLHHTIILDDGGSRDVRQLAGELGVWYLARKGSEGAKAGNINNALHKTNAEFFVIFDADFAPKPEFLYETLPFFYDHKLAFVQTPQTYGNLHNSISRGAGFMQQVFYRLVQPGKNRFNSAFCVGTNVVFRRSAIDHVGGMYQKSKSEDIWTSLRLHEAGYKSIYTPESLALGDTPDSIKTYCKQQLRWATGGMEILFWHNPLLSSRLSASQRIQYASTAAFYLQGVAAAFLIALPPLQIFFGLTPINLSIAFAAWLFYFLSFYALQISVASYAMGGFRVETILLGMTSFPIYIKALFNGMLCRDHAWQATGATKIDSPYNYVVAQILIFLFLCFTDFVGVLKTWHTHSLSLTLFWSFLNTVIFAGFLLLATKEHLHLNHVAKRQRREARRQARRGRKRNERRAI